ncbi:MAG: hypothetical protein N2C14_24900, partial [Planctomycetales bacterium]
ALKEEGKRLAKLRRLKQLRDRESTTESSLASLAESYEDSAGPLELPAWAMYVSAGVLALGVVMCGLGLVMQWDPAAWLGSLFSVLGLVGMIGTVVTRYYQDESQGRKLKSHDRQVQELKGELAEVRESLERIDEDAAASQRPLNQQVEDAEEEIARLEELVPLAARRDGLMEESRQSEARLKQRYQEYRKALKRYHKALAELGLPEQTNPAQLRDYQEAFEKLSILAGRLGSRREELARERRSLVALSAQISQAWDDVGMVPVAKEPREQLRELVETLREQRKLAARRKELERQYRSARRLQAKAAASASGMERRRRRLLQEAGVDSEEEFRELAALHADRVELKKERDKLNRQIASALAGGCSEEEIRRELEGKKAEHLDSRRNRLGDAVDACREHCEERFEARGRLTEQLRQLADDREADDKRLELATVAAGLREAQKRWQVLGVVRLLLDQVRRDHERHRQPQTLQEASLYLNRLSEGRYVRVWTPLDEECLKVDDDQGRTISIEHLSRGTREQLFLGLRLALVSQHARQGASLPMVMDDLLVNFDDQRAEEAASLLKDFAAQGRQILVFTCHDHIVRLFKKLNVPVRELPSRDAIPVGNQHDAAAESIPALDAPLEDLPAAGAPSFAADENLEVGEISLTEGLAGQPACEESLGAATEEFPLGSEADEVLESRAVKALYELAGDEVELEPDDNIELIELEEDSTLFSEEYEPGADSSDAWSSDGTEDLVEETVGTEEETLDDTDSLLHEVEDAEDEFAATESDEFESSEDEDNLSELEDEDTLSELEDEHNLSELEDEAEDEWIEEDAVSPAADSSDDQQAEDEVDADAEWQDDQHEAA